MRLALRHRPLKRKLQKFEFSTDWGVDSEIATDMQVSRRGCGTSTVSIDEAEEKVRAVLSRDQTKRFIRRIFCYEMVASAQVSV